MKKIYQNPEIKVIKVQSAQMIATSINAYGKNAERDAMSRKSDSYWDDDEEDEEDY